MPTSRLHSTFAQCRAEHRAALIGYLPAGYPTVAGSIDTVRTMVESGCDIIEVGIAYSDPVMDGPTIQAAAEQALSNGVRVRDVFTVCEQIAAAGGKAVVMTYWNPVLQYGVDRYADDLLAAGGAGLITPDITPEAAPEWIAASERTGLDRVFRHTPSGGSRRSCAGPATR